MPPMSNRKAMQVSNLPRVVAGAGSVWISVVTCPINLGFRRQALRQTFETERLATRGTLRNS